MKQIASTVIILLTLLLPTVSWGGVDGLPSIEGGNNNTAEIFILDCRHNKDGIGDVVDAYFSELNR